MRRERGMPTALLFVGLWLFVEGLNNTVYLWLSASALLLALFLVRDTSRHYIDIRKQRERIAQAQGKTGTRN